jgi:hypothetical protein
VAVEFNRNQYFMAGIVLLLLGIQFRLTESFTLNERATRFLAGRAVASERPVGAAIMPASVARRSIRPPQWLGWSLMSVGSVLILHSLAMRKPGG